MDIQVDYSQNYFSRRRSLDELLDLKDDESGYIEGKVFMIWPPRNRLHRINIEVVEGNVLYRFEVEVPYEDGITFRPHERVCFSLKGIKVDRRKASSAPHGFPIVLRYPDGVVLKYLSGTNAGKVIDTWAACTTNTDEWYNPVPDAGKTDASKTCHSPIPSIRPHHIQDVSVDQSLPRLLPIAVGVATAQSTRPAQQSNAEISGRGSRSRQRKKKRMLKEKQKRSISPNRPANDTDKSVPADDTTPCHEQLQTSTSLTDVPDSRLQRHQVGGHANGGASIVGDIDIDISRENNSNDLVVVSGEVQVDILAPQLTAGICTQRGDIFTALSELKTGQSLINVIGIVTYVTPERKTSTNEWNRSITILDPSIVGNSGIKVNCFQKRYPEWLPQVRRDDIVILRKLKVVGYRDTVSATGYGDKLRWAVYDPLTHSARPPNKGNAPEKELTDGGMGYEYSPYWEPFDSIELGYCRQIGEWWKGFEGKAYTVQCSGNVLKQHRLISEASPDLPPRGFFNCTVEVLKKFDNHGGATTVYVTDYTASAFVRPVQATWCPPQLSDRVLQCSMWDDAKSIAKMMNPGEYWYLYNNRARWNPDHHMEGTMQLAEKVIQLDETRLEVQPHLSALLARKKEFELNNSSLTSGSALPHIFPETLLQDVEESTNFLTCIVELLHTDLNSRDGHFLYVTDYTYNSDLPTAVSTADWARNLEHRVVKVKLTDAQAKISSDLRPGSMYIVQNMRVRRSSISGGMQGCLGGGDTLIVSLSTHRAGTLQRNKEKWKRENMLNAPMIHSKESQGESHDPHKQLSTVISHATLQEAHGLPAPAVFKVLARAMDFFPYSLEDACILRCTKCESCLPPTHNVCLRCDDLLETHCKWFYCLYILLQDEKGDELIVSLSGKECTLLQGVDPTDFRSDQAAFHKFLEKLDPILGNLRNVHLAWSKNESKVIESPKMTFTIESWNVGDEKGYALLGTQ